MNPIDERYSDENIFAQLVETCADEEKLDELKAYNDRLFQKIQKWNDDEAAFDKKYNYDPTIDYNKLYGYEKNGGDEAVDAPIDEDDEEMKSEDSIFVSEQLDQVESKPVIDYETDWSAELPIAPPRKRDVKKQRRVCFPPYYKVAPEDANASEEVFLIGPLPPQLRYNWCSIYRKFNELLVTPNKKYRKFRNLATAITADYELMFEYILMVTTDSKLVKYNLNSFETQDQFQRMRQWIAWIFNDDYRKLTKKTSRGSPKLTWRNFWHLDHDAFLKKIEEDEAKPVSQSDDTLSEHSEDYDCGWFDETKYNDEMEAALDMENITITNMAKIRKLRPEYLKYAKMAEEEEEYPLLKERYLKYAEDAWEDMQSYGYTDPKPTTAEIQIQPRQFDDDEISDFSPEQLDTLNQIKSQSTPMDTPNKSLSPEGTFHLHDFVEMKPEPLVQSPPPELNLDKDGWEIPPELLFAIDEEVPDMVIEDYVDPNPEEHDCESEQFRYIMDNLRALAENKPSLPQPNLDVGYIQGDVWGVTQSAFEKMTKQQSGENLIALLIKLIFKYQKIEYTPVEELTLYASGYKKKFDERFPLYRTGTANIHYQPALYSDHWMLNVIQRDNFNNHVIIDSYNILDDPSQKECIQKYKDIFFPGITEETEDFALKVQTDNKTCGLWMIVNMIFHHKRQRFIKPRISIEDFASVIRAAFTYAISVSPDKYYQEGFLAKMFDSAFFDTEERYLRNFQC